MSRRRLLGAWALGIACVAAAWGVSQLIPPESSAEAPFIVPAELGERAEGRALAVTVSEAVLADSVSAGRWSASGRWLMVELEAEAKISETAALLGHAALIVQGPEGGELWLRASERPASLLGAPLHVGVPQSGGLAFELPPGVGGVARLQLARSADTRLDSVIEVPIDLDALDRVPERELPTTGWAAS